MTHYCKIFSLQQKVKVCIWLNFTIRSRCIYNPAHFCRTCSPPEKVKVCIRLKGNKFCDTLPLFNVYTPAVLLQILHSATESESVHSGGTLHSVIPFVPSAESASCFRR